MIKTLASNERSRKADISLGMILAFIAGGVNAGGYLAIGQYTSHMTGILSSIADFIVLNKFYAAFLSLTFLIYFISGAATSAVIINWARARKIQSEYALPLMLESFLLILFGLMIAEEPGFIKTTIALLCYIMGLQNAIITKISRSEIRTTHVTGMATDIGIELGRIFYKYIRMDSQIAINTAKLGLYISIVGTFLIGAIIGALLFKDFGAFAVFPFSMILFLISLAPVISDIKNSYSN